jgi:hypothetical protein
VYDMYPWHSAGPAERPPGTPRAGGAATSPQGTNAVQVALDRRDNGGDPAAAPGTPTAGPTRQ